MNILLFQKFKYEISYFIGVLIIGIAQFPRYGIGWDEFAMRQIGGNASKHILEILAPWSIKYFEDIPNFDLIGAYTAAQGSMGVITQLPLLISEIVLGISVNPAAVHKVRHLLIFVMCAFAYPALIRYLRWRYQSLKYALLGATFLLISPRYFADSFYNEKDLPFATLYLLTCIGFISFLRSRNATSLILLSFLLGMSISLRAVALILLLIVLVFLLTTARSLLAGLKTSCKLISVTLFSYFVFSPYLWNKPISGAIEIWKLSSNFGWNGQILTQGQYLVSTDLPWSYLFMWILVTIPVIYLAFGFLGILFSSIFLIKSFIGSKNRILICDKELADLFLLSALLVPIVVLVLTDAVIYDGWRHFTFIYPILVVFMVSTLAHIESLFGEFPGRLGTTVAIFGLVSTAYWMVEHRPLQNVYFNQLAKDPIHKNWEVDYWGLANREALEYIAALDKKKQISVYVASATPLKYSLIFLSQEDQSRIRIVESIETADYVFSNFRNYNSESFRMDLTQLTPQYSRFVGEVKVYTIWKKKK